MIATGKRAEVRTAARDAAAGRMLVALAVAALLAIGLLYFAARRPHLAVDDAAVYVASAQSLAQGHGYLLAGYLAEPPNTFYPPGYSLLLAALLRLGPDFPASLVWLQAASLVAFGVLLALGALCLRHLYAATVADTLLALLLVASTPLALWLSTAVLSDSLYGALSLGSLLAVWAGRRGGRHALAWLVLGVLLATCAYYARTAGLALLAALALVALRDARRVPWPRTALLLLPAPLSLPWTLWTTWNGGSGYLRHWLNGIPGWHLGLNDPANALAIVWDNLANGDGVLWVVAPVLLDVHPLALILFLWILWCATRAWWRTNEPVHLYVVLTLGLLLLWPYQVRGRFLWPLAPLLAWYLVAGVRAAWAPVAARLGPRPLPLPGIVLGLLLLLNGLGLVGTAARTLASGWPVDQASRDQMAALLVTVDYVRANTPPSAVLGSNHWSTASWYYLYTGRRSVDAVARADGLEPYFTRRALEGDPAAITHFLYQSANGLPDAGEEDLPVVHAALAARGVSTEPLYCAGDGYVCVYDWQPAATTGRPP